MESMLAAACRAWPAQPAFDLPEGRTIPFSLVAEVIDDIRASLRSRGIAREHHVGLVAPISPDVGLMSACLISSAAAVHLQPNMPAPELDSAISRIGLRAIVGPADASTIARDAAARAGIPWLDLHPDPASGRITLNGPAAGPPVPDRPADPEDFSTIALTSGSTGRAKIVPRSHRNAVEMAQRSENLVPLPPGHRTTVLMPVHHYGWVLVLRSLHTGGRIALPGDYDLKTLPGVLADHRPNWLFVNPSMLDHLARIGPVNDALSFVQVSASAMPAGLRERAETSLGVPVLNAYGSNEAGTIALQTPAGPNRAGEAGIPTVPLRIVDETGQQLPAGQPGAILVPAHDVFPGYIDDPLANARAFTGDGWFRMGDRGVLDERGMLTVLGRNDDVINVGGAKIDPLEVESVLLAHPYVAECAVFAVPHPEHGSAVAAAIVLAPGAAPEPRALRRWVLDRLIPHKAPRSIVFVDALPRTPNGKIRRAALTEQFSPHAPAEE
ncbi:MAG: class I adenylate-forming enzyme family protein [Thermomicrobiales bacterium]